jgi:hypothetical protein
LELDYCKHELGWKFDSRIYYHATNSRFASHDWKPDWLRLKPHSPFPDMVVQEFQVIKVLLLVQKM